MAGTVLVLAVAIAIILLTQFGWERIAQAAALGPLESANANYMIVVELGIAGAVAWWPYIGSLTRNSRTTSGAILPSILGLGAMMSAVLVIRHAALPMVMRDAFWDRYQIGKARKIKDGKDWARRNPYRSSEGIPKQWASYSLEAFRPLLDGTTNWPAVLEAFDRTGYRGHLTFEYFHPYQHYPEALVYQTADSLDRMLGLKA